MNKPIDARLLQPSEAFADYLKNTAARIDQGAETLAHDQGARVGISRPHESAQLHVAGSGSQNILMPGSICQFCGRQLE